MIFVYTKLWQFPLFQMVHDQPNDHSALISWGLSTSQLDKGRLFVAMTLHIWSWFEMVSCETHWGAATCFVFDIGNPIFWWQWPHGPASATGWLFFSTWATKPFGNLGLAATNSSLDAKCPTNFSGVGQNMLLSSFRIQIMSTVVGQYE